MVVLETNFRQIRVQLDDALAESVDVLRQQLIRVGDSVVQIGHLVEGEAAAKTDTRDFERNLLQSYQDPNR